MYIHRYTGTFRRAKSGEPARLNRHLSLLWPQSYVLFARRVAELGAMMAIDRGSTHSPCSLGVPATAYGPRMLAYFVHTYLYICTYRLGVRSAALTLRGARLAVAYGGRALLPDRHWPHWLSPSAL